MKLKIISDGTTKGTRVVNAATGEIVENVRRVVWEQSIYGNVIAFIEIENVELGTPSSDGGDDGT